MKNSGLKKGQPKVDLLVNYKVYNLEEKKFGILQSSDSRPTSCCKTSSQNVALSIQFNLSHLSAVHRPKIRNCSGAQNLPLNFPLKCVISPTPPPPPPRVLLTLQCSGEPGGHRKAHSYNGADCTQVISLALCSNSTADFSYCSHHFYANIRKERRE